jgi:Tfp pilus assembly protein PilX
MKKTQNGSILLVFLITLPFLILIALYYMQLALTSAQVARLDQLSTSAQLSADAGADYSIQQISQDSAWAGTGSEVQLQDDGKVRTTYTSSVSGDNTAKTITVTGRSYWPANSSTPKRSVTIYVDLRPVTSASYSVVTGAGGLYMSNSSKVVGGSVFVNGELVMSNSATIGLNIQPVNVKVAHQICPNPPDATFPKVCANGENGQPISMTNTSRIYGEVKATNQSNGANMSNPGLVAGTVTPQPLPTYDRAAQQAAVSTNLTGAQASCSGSQTKTWQANTKITGDVTISNNCVVTMLGDVWITGKLIMTNQAEVKIDNTMGSVRPHVMVDGQNGIKLSNSAKITPNNVDTGAEFYTFYSSAGCSPDCSSVTGVSLANSRSVTTIDMDNAASAQSSILYAYWSRVKLGNSGQIGAVIGQTIEMSNTAAITFGASTGFGNTVWVVNGYRQQ